MIIAEMKHKIPKLETWEDILTSNVFGLLELIDYKYLLELLLIAKNNKNNTIKTKLQNKKIKTIELWKNFKNIGEPDILVILEDGTFFIIEVKYFGDEHNTKKTNHNEEYEQGQLAKYFNIEVENKKNDFIIYLTANYHSLKHIEKSASNSKEYLNNIYHIHWSEFNEYLTKITDTHGIEKKIINKIIEYLNFKGFRPWQGFKYTIEYDIPINTKGFYEV